MKMIVGLGNPGKKYERTRHNIGFLVIDNLIEELKGRSISKKNKFNAIIVETKVNDEKVIIVKPLTYMNLSGEAVKPIKDWYKIENDNILVVYDDLDLPVGKIRYREKGSSGGHNGLKSIIYHLGDENFKRIKIGIDKPKTISIVDYVLTEFTDDEKEIIIESIKKTTSTINDWLNGAEINKVNNIIM